MSIEAMKQIQQCLKDKMYAHAEMYLAEAIAEAEKQKPMAFITPLMEQQLFDDWCPYKGNPDPRTVWAAAIEAVNGLLLAHPQPKQEQGEPVAKRLDPDDAWNFAKHVWNEMDRKSMPGVYMQLVTESIVKHYTTPQQRKPLTDEQMNALWFDTNKQHGSVIWRFARAIEAAHGIRPSDFKE